MLPAAGLGVGLLYRTVVLRNAVLVGADLLPREGGVRGGYDFDKVGVGAGKGVGGDLLDPIHRVLDTRIILAEGDPLYSVTHVPLVHELNVDVVHVAVVAVEAPARREVEVSLHFLYLQVPVEAAPLVRLRHHLLLVPLVDALGDGIEPRKAPPLSGVRLLHILTRITAISFVPLRSVATPAPRLCLGYFHGRFWGGGVLLLPRVYYLILAQWLPIPPKPLLVYIVRNP
mmetsp:Transcript_22591/g.63419  ORF Transcript_22591/g.63419 Transcript_22591/m.63419 type:complete len:229 (-) Transcript_22591:376-1062(-)